MSVALSRFAFRLGSRFVSRPVRGLGAPCAGTLALALVCAVGVGTARAEDPKVSSVDEFDTFRGGIRLGFWIRPELKDLSLKVPIQSTAPANVQTLPREFDAKDVGLDASDPTMADVVNGVHGAPTGELFLDTRWISLSLRGVAPFQYKGTKTFTAQTLKVGNLEIAAGALVKSKLILWLAGFDVAVNILNDQYVRVGPVIGLRALGLHASVTGRGSVTVNGQTAGRFKAGAKAAPGRCSPDPARNSPPPRRVSPSPPDRRAHGSYSPPNR